MKLVYIVLAVVFAVVCNVQAALFPLEITNIKPAGTGNPVIPATNRIFRAHPGIEYNIRAAVIGGVYPYNYSLSNAPSGMTINAATGEISWPNPQSNSGPITLSITDSEGATESTTWSITVSTSGFHFVDINAASNGAGTISSPFSSLDNFLNATFGGTTSDIVYFRGGTYNLNSFNAGGNPNVNISYSPMVWVGYPGETVIMQGAIDTGRAASILALYGHAGLYFDNLTFNGMSNYGLFLADDGDYTTIRRCVFNGLAPRDGVNNNYGFVYIENNGEVLKHGLVIQDNEMMDWYRAAAIGSLYYESKALIENNYIHNPSTATDPSGISVTLGLAIKSNLPYLTVRGNRIDMNVGSVVGSSVNNWFHIEYMDMVYNYFKNLSASAIIEFNGQQSSSGPNKYHNIKRNTIVDGTARFRFDPCDYNSGPFNIDKNVFLLSSNQLDRACVDYGDNVTSTIDSETGKLLSSVGVGVYGWQLADGSTPMEGASSPVPVNGACGTADGGSFSTPPTTNLCSAGTAGTVSGDGPWTWPCNGINGGSSDSCSATLLSSGITWVTSGEPNVVITDPLTGHAIGPPQ